MTSKYSAIHSRRRFLAHTATLCASLGSIEALLSACGTAKTAQSLNFANWASAETTTRDTINKALQAFENQNTVQVNNIGMPFNDVLNQVTAMTKAHIPADVVEMSGNWPYALGAQNALVDLNPFISQAWRDDAFPNSFEVGTYKGAVYAVPFSITPHGFWYSKTLMQQAGLDPTTPPKTINDLNQAMAILRSNLPNDAYPLGIDTSATEYALVGFWPWIWTFGGNPMKEDQSGNVTVNWADDGTVAACQWLQDAVKKRWTPLGLAIKDERSMMAFGKLAFKLDGPYLTGQLGTANPNVLGSVQQVNQQFGVTTTPMGPGISQPVTCADIHQLGMSSLTKNKQQAWDLINFLTTSKDVITSFLIPEGGVLPYRSYNSGSYARYYADDISQAFITKVIPTMRPPAYSPPYSQAAALVVQALQEIANGTSVKPRLTKLTSDVRALYSEK